VGTSREKKREAAKGFLFGEKGGPSRHMTREKNEKSSNLDTRPKHTPSL